MKYRKRVASFVRKPTATGAALTLWWLGIIATGLVGFVSPGGVVSAAIGTPAARGAVSGSYIIVGTIGLLSRFFKTRESERSAIWGVAGLTVCHAIIFLVGTLAITGGLAGGVQMFLRLATQVPVIWAVGLLIGGRTYKLEAPEEAP